MVTSIDDADSGNVDKLGEVRGQVVGGCWRLGGRSGEEAAGGGFTVDGRGGLIHNM